MNNEFHPGQRWISNTESDLGMGFIEKVEGRHITVIFPAIDETRVYAMDNAPLTRVRYPLGETIQTEDGEQLTVRRHDEHNHCIVYEGVDANGRKMRIHELELDSFARFSQPQDRLFAGQVDKISQFELRVAALNYQHEQHSSPALGLLGPRVQLLPHQFYIAHQVSGRHEPRVLLADEVGLGKTIEAGLILHQQIVTGRVKRALIVVPESLLHQWLVEMLRRFNLHFTILDEDRCFAVEEEGDTATHNPFDSAQLVLTSLDFLTQNPIRHQQALDAGWDLMIVDEAHHLSWSETHVSNEYVAIEGLARQIPGLLLLTATPEQLGIESHFARLKLLDPDRFHNLKQFKSEETGYRDVNELVQWLQGNPANWQDSARLEQLRGYLGKEAVDDFCAATLAVDSVTQGDKSASAIAQQISPAETLIQQLLDRHGTGRVLFRNTRDAVKGFPQRKLHTYALDLPHIYQPQADTSLEDRLHPETANNPSLQSLDWVQHDPRIKWLHDWLDQHPGEKVLLICAHASTAKALEAHLRLQTQFTPSLFHEEMSIVERDRAAAYFSTASEDDETGANILICSEIGSEGRNFQFAHHLILFDLPLNPDLLEQRIGRLDRIGQTETIRIHVPYFADGTQHRLLRWYDQGLNIFSHVCAIGHSVFETFEDELRRELIEDNGQFEELLQRTRLLTRDTLARMQEGRDRLLELNSCHPRHAHEIVSEVSHMSKALALSSFMDAVFDHYGVDQQTQGGDRVIIKPTEHMTQSHFPGLAEDGMMATYQRTTALAREDLHFLSWEHPVVSGAMDMIINSEFGNATFCTLELGDTQLGNTLPPGTLLIETIYRIHCPAPAYLQVQRYLPDAMIRRVLDSNGQQLDAQLDHSFINQHAQRINKRTLSELIRHAQPHIQKLVEQVQQQIEPEQDDVIRKASELASNELLEETQRLTALARVNPAIRQSEIKHLKQSSDDLLDHLALAQLRLDAIRVALVTG